MLDACYPYIERTLLHPAVTIDEQFAALEEVNRLGLAGLTVAPFWVKKWRREMGDGHPAALTAVIGYPFGYQRTEARQLELELALADGASEAEVVLNTSALFSPTSVWIKIELAKLVAVAHAQEVPLTVVLESALLPDDLLKKMVKTASDAGAGFLKNATGASMESFSMDKALAFRRLVSGSVGVKIAGDGASGEDLRHLIESGVDRISLSRL